ncbi:MAG: alanine--tRNA ligase [Magnetococcales bacterium]|nr:alanine--tRNA ligase [Magnetococcales bacterium]
MTGDDIRKRFITFFQGHDHTQVASSSLIPHNDPTLLFTNAGMNQFKGVFLGEERRSYKRAVTSQKCVRAGGKHNDLENVGRTARHHTFFEMLGNFSFGDYFKEAAIPLAWEFVTENLKLPVDRLLVTVYAQDDEAYTIWREKVGLPEDKVVRIPTSDNFWSMGETGPCGPCSEIFYDNGPDIPGGPPGSADEDGDRFVEIWNLVFMQYDRDSEGNLNPLPNPCIDTGAGLERITAILQGKTNNYDSDLFQPLIQAAAEVAGIAYGQAPESDVSLRVIADHIRAACFLIADGVLPSNEGRGYVLRRIMRRAMRHGQMLGLKKPFMHNLVSVFVALMGGAYPELASQSGILAMVIENEEKRFALTLGTGLKILEEALSGLKPGDELDGQTAFTLYDTYGFPVDLTADIARDRGVGLDMAGFESHMAEQKKRARAAWSGAGGEKVAALYHELREATGPSEFLGYVAESAAGVIQGLVLEGARVDRLEKGQKGAILTNQTPFYGESGGQVGDQGVITTDTAHFVVTNTQKPLGDLTVHQGFLKSGELTVGDAVTLEVDQERRSNIRLHHSATHFLHHALTETLGSHVKQAGSLVAHDRLRFDFSHFQGLTPEEIETLEERVNAGILANTPQETTVMTPEEAVAAGARALFGEKYGEEVRVVRIGETMELCGGTHVQRSGDIGLFRILSESAVAAGVRRIEGVCGHVARRGLRGEVQLLNQAAELMKLPGGQLVEGIQKLLARQKELERALDKAKSDLSGNLVGDLAAQVKDIKGIPVLVAKVEGVEAKGLRDLLDKIKDQLGSGVVLLGVPAPGKVSLIAGVTKDLTGRIKAGDLIRFIAPQLGGKGGGRPDMAQGGGTRPEQLTEAFAAVPAWIEERT